MHLLFAKKKKKSVQVSIVRKLKGVPLDHTYFIIDSTIDCIKTG